MWSIMLKLAIVCVIGGLGCALASILWSLVSPDRQRRLILRSIARGYQVAGISMSILGAAAITNLLDLDEETGTIVGFVSFFTFGLFSVLMADEWLKRRLADSTIPILPSDDDRS